MRRAEWTLLTAAGLAGGLIAGLLIGMPLGQIVNAMIVTAAVTCLVGGVLGGAQAIGLRRILRRPLWWIVATTVGIGAGLAAGVVLVEQIGIALTGVRPNVARLAMGPRALSMIALGLVAGSIVGAAQWLVLRAQRAGVQHWIPASGLALAAAFAGSSLLLDAAGLRLGSPAGVIAFVLASGLGFGLLTSGPLVSRPAGSPPSS
jgi:hypothetical protein